MADRIPYRKLPGHRRGFLRGSSVWLGPDHLLAVNSMRFREEYKRYFFRDIQAIVIAKRPRFHLSTRAALVGFVWFIVFLSLLRAPQGPIVTGAAGITLVAVWLLVSATCSCTCRIYTAVSQDSLPSVYRVWLAQKFLRAVEPRISRLQGPLEHPLSDFETVHLGPPQPVAPEASAAAPPVGDHPLPARHRAFSFPVLVATLFADAVWIWLRFQHILRPSALISDVLAVLEIGTAILVLIDHHRHRASPARQKLAIATLVGIGLFFYGAIIGGAATAGFNSAAKQPLDTAVFARFEDQLNIGATLLLALFGLGILILDKPANREPRSLVS